MQSESARATTAAEARFRIDAPNSQPRAVKVIALDRASERVVKRIAAGRWGRATFLTSIESAPAGDTAFSMTNWLADLAGSAKNLVDEIDSADLVVLVAAAGGSPQAASVIGEAAQLKNVMTTGLIVDAKGQPGEALSRTLLCLRPYAAMLVVADGEDYIEAMLSALRA
jgi:hypothetical protein